jgi:hypothetical protein
MGPSDGPFLLALVVVVVVLLAGCGGDGGSTAAQQASAPVPDATVTATRNELTLEYPDGSKLILEANFVTGDGSSPECFIGARLLRKNFPVEDRAGDTRMALDLEPCEY